VGSASPAYSFTIPFGNVNALTPIAYGIYTMTITTQNNVNPSQICAVYNAPFEFSWATTDGTTTLPLIVLSNP